MLMSWTLLPSSGPPSACDPPALPVQAPEPAARARARVKGASFDRRCKIIEILPHGNRTRVRFRGPSSKRAGARKFPSGAARALPLPVALRSRAEVSAEAAPDGTARACAENQRRHQQERRSRGAAASRLAHADEAAIAAGRAARAAAAADDDRLRAGRFEGRRRGE